MTEQTELFHQEEQVGNLLREIPVKPRNFVGRILFEHPLPDMRGMPPAVPVATSIEAADAIKPCVNTLRRRVLDYIASQGRDGATDDETQVVLGMNGSTQRPRRIELFQQGKICMAPMMRKTRAGRNANVWIVTP